MTFLTANVDVDEEDFSFEQEEDQSFLFFLVEK